MEQGRWPGMQGGDAGSEGQRGHAMGAGKRCSVMPHKSWSDKAVEGDLGLGKAPQADARDEARAMQVTGRRGKAGHGDAGVGEALQDKARERRRGAQRGVDEAGRGTAGQERGVARR